MVKEITVQELAYLKENGSDYQLIDVREPYERKIASIEGELVPLAQIMSFADNIARDKKVIIYCRSGSRSAQAVIQLEKQNGFDNLYNLKGGILAWAKEIDPTVAKY